MFKRYIGEICRGEMEGEYEPILLYVYMKLSNNCTIMLYIKPYNNHIYILFFKHNNNYQCKSNSFYKLYGQHIVFSFH